jgi:hypothetical protein
VDKRRSPEESWGHLSRWTRDDRKPWKELSVREEQSRKDSVRNVKLHHEG